MTDNFFPGFAASMAESDEVSQSTYERKILKLIYKAVYDDREFRRDRIEAGEDFGLDWFNDTRDIPTVLFAKRKITVTPANVLRTAGFTKTDLYAEFHFVADRLDPGIPSAMFFPIAGMSQFVIHNATFLEIMPGQNIVTRRGRKEADMLRIEPVASFLASLAVQHGS